MPINRLKNRQDLYNLIRPDLKKNGNVISFDDFISMFFASSETFNLNLPKTVNGNLKYTNLYDYLTKAKLQNGRTFIDTYGTPDNILGNGSMISIKTFYNAFACNDFAWAANSYCINSEDSVDHQTSDLNPYCGFFTIENNNFLKTANIRLNNDGVSLILSLSDLSSSTNSIYKKYGKLILKHVGGGVFDIYLDDTKLDDVNNKITFKDQNKKFDFKLISIITGTAVRKDLNTPTPTPTTTSTSTSSTTPTSNNNDNPPVVINKTTIDLSSLDDDGKNQGSVQPKPKENFPFKLYDQNDLIGDINKIFFGDRLGNTFNESLLFKLRTKGIIAMDDKDPTIDPDLYKKIIKVYTGDVIKESVKKVLKEYINSKK